MSLHPDVVASLHAVDSPVLMVGNGGTILAWNPRAEQLLDVPAGEAVGRNLADLDACAPPLLDAVMRASRATGAQTLEGVDCRRRDGSTITVSVSIAPLPDIDAALLTLTERDSSSSGRRGGPLRFGGRSDVDPDRFLAVLAHELRNPLSPILTAIHVIRALSRGDIKITRAVQVVERQVAHIGHLVDDLLDVERVIRGKIAIERLPVSLPTAIEEALESTAHLIKVGRHEVSWHPPGDTLVVRGDPTRLVQVFSNLIGNAAKYTPPQGRIAVTVQRDQDHAVAEVSDNGLGISADLLPRVFEMFAQAESSLARSAGGLGIGLALVRQIVELHGGSVAAHSEGLGRGSRFVVRLPLLATSEAEPASTEPAWNASRPRRVLIIEDNRDARQMLKIALELEGHEVHSAMHGAQGVSIATQFAPDVVVLDIGLPGLDGYEVGRRIRAALGDRVLLIAMTGYGDTLAKDRARQAGFDAHLTKPVHPTDLGRLIAGGQPEP